MPERPCILRCATGADAVASGRAACRIENGIGERLLTHAPVKFHVSERGETGGNHQPKNHAPGIPADEALIDGQQGEAKRDGEIPTGEESGAESGRGQFPFRSVYTAANENRATHPLPGARRALRFSPLSPRLRCPHFAARRRSAKRTTRAARNDSDRTERARQSRSSRRSHLPCSETPR